MNGPLEDGSEALQTCSCVSCNVPSEAFTENILTFSMDFQILDLNTFNRRVPVCMPHCPACPIPFRVVSRCFAPPWQVLSPPHTAWPLQPQPSLQMTPAKAENSAKHCRLSKVLAFLLSSHHDESCTVWGEVWSE